MADPRIGCYGNELELNRFPAKADACSVRDPARDGRQFRAFCLTLKARGC